MPILYKVLTALLALTGCSSLAITGQISPVMSSVAVALIPGYYRFFRGEKHAPIRVIGMLTFTELLVFLFDAVVVTGDVFLAVAHLTIAFQAIKSFDLKEPWDHLQVYFVSLLQLIIASELTSSLAFGVVFVVFMVLLVTAMVYSHFLKEASPHQSLAHSVVRKPVYLISVLTIGLTVLFFIGLPRFTYRFIGKGLARGIHTTGFSGRMDFGSLGTVKLDPTVVMRVELVGQAEGPFYWRGSTLDYFDGITWRNEIRTKTRLRRTADEFVLDAGEKNAVSSQSPEQSSRQTLQQKIDLEPLDSDVIFGLPRASSIRADAYALSVDAAGNISLPGKASRRIRYTVSSAVSDRIPGPAEDLYLQVPAGSGRIAELARGLVRNRPDDEARARAIADHLRSNYVYSLAVSPPPKGVPPIEDFLFRTKKGYCEHYASAMVLMLRTIGIHARVVTGFIGGDRNTYGGYIIVRQSDAHSWVEARIGGQWQRFDPTPPVVATRAASYTLLWDSIKMTWSRYVVGFKSEDRRVLFGRFSSGLGWIGRLTGLSGSGTMGGRNAAVLIVLALGSLFAIVFLAKRRWQGRGCPKATRAYLKVRGALAGKGVRITPFTTAADIELQSAQYPFYQQLREFHASYIRARFGREGDGEMVLRQARDLIREIAKSRKRGAGR